MKPAGAMTLVFLAVGSAAYALSCNTEPTGDMIAEIMRFHAGAQAGDLEGPALGLGRLSDPLRPDCSATDWTGKTTCTATQNFTGTLYSVAGRADVSDMPVESIFYEFALSVPVKDTFAFWRPMKEEPALMQFHSNLDGALFFTHLDTCGISFLAPETPELRAALDTCHERGGCRGSARKYLKSLN